MQLLFPAGLTLLSLAGLVLLFHALRPRYRKQEVPSLLLWAEVNETLSRYARYRRILRTLLLFVHLSIVLLLSLALAQPMLRGGAAKPLHVHIIDASASMLAEDVRPNRFAVAADQVQTALARSSGPWAILIADNTPQVIYHGNSAADASAALTSVQPVVAETDWQTVADLIGSLRETSKELILWTDGVVDADSFARFRDALEDPVTIHLVGTDDPVNLGISAFTARQAGEDPYALELLLRVRNYAGEPVAAIVRLSAGDTALYEREHRFEPHEEIAITLPVRLAGSTRLSATIDMDDSLPWDNTAHLLLAPPRTVRVALVGPSSRHFAEALALYPHVEVDRRLWIDEGDRYHLRVYNGLPPDHFPGVRVSFAPPAGAPLHSTPHILWWDETHPLTRYIDWSSIRIVRASALPTDPDTVVLVDSDIGPLATVEHGDGVVIRFGFALDDSDLPLRVAFPVLVDHLLRYAHPAAMDPLHPPVQPGHWVDLEELISIELPAEGVQVIGPDGAPLAIARRGGRTLVLPRLTGLHRVHAQEMTYEFSVGLIPGSESALQRRLSAEAPAEPPAAEAGHGLKPLWRPIIIIVLLLLIAESVLFQKRAMPPVKSALQTRSVRREGAR